MRVCAEFEDHYAALEAHRHLINEGLDPQEIEIRSPYPLPEHPIPPHRDAPMHMRTVARIMWAIAVMCGFTFITYTQYEWAPVTVTNGHPLIPIPITMLPTYECGMITGILTTTFMFFLETFRYRQLVPPLEEDMPVAIGYVVLVVGGRSADRALKLLEGKGARSVVSYLVMFMMLTFLTGCAQFNHREQDVTKSTEAAAMYLPQHSVRMPSLSEQSVPPPRPIGYYQSGDQAAFNEMRAYQAQALRRVMGTDEAEKKNVNQSMQAADAARNRMLASGTYPKIWALKEDGGMVQKMSSWTNPVKPTPAALERGKNLYTTNCASCHGVKGDGKGPVGELCQPVPPAIGTAVYKGGQYTDGYFYYYIYVGKNNMPTFGTKLTPEEISSIVLHLREMQNVQ